MDADLTETVQSVNEDSAEPVTEVLQPVTSSEADAMGAEETPEELSEKEETLQNDSDKDAECDDSPESLSEAEENPEADSAQTSAEISEKETAVGETISSEPPEPNIKSPPAFTKNFENSASVRGLPNRFTSAQTAFIEKSGKSPPGITNRPFGNALPNS